MYVMLAMLSAVKTSSMECAELVQSLSNSSQVDFFDCTVEVGIPDEVPRLFAKQWMAGKS